MQSWKFPIALRAETSFPLQFCTKISVQTKESLLFQCRFFQGRNPLCSTVYASEFWFTDWVHEILRSRRKQLNFGIHGFFSLLLLIVLLWCFKYNRINIAIYCLCCSCRIGETRVVWDSLRANPCYCGVDHDLEGKHQQSWESHTIRNRNLVGKYLNTDKNLDYKLYSDKE